MIASPMYFSTLPPWRAISAAMVEKSIPFSRLVVRTASSARADLTGLFDILAKDDPRIIGGKQPGDGFYAL